MLLNLIRRHLKLSFGLLPSSNALTALAKGPTVPAPHGPFRVGKFNVGAVRRYTQGSLHLGTKILTHGLRFVTHSANALDLNVAGGVSGSPKSHGGAGLKGCHHIGLRLT